MQQITYYQHDTAENILWQPQEQALYWVDIPAGELYRGSFHGKEVAENFQSTCILKMDEPIGGFVFRRAPGPRLLLFCGEGRIYEYKPGAEPRLFCCAAQLVPTRFNDVFALPSGDVLCGVMPTQSDADSRLLLCHVSSRTVTPVLENLKLANGMGLSGDEKYLYFADTRAFMIYRFAHQKGTIGWQNPQKWIHFHSRLGRPDGLCVDRAGRIWVAETGAGCVSCFSADREFLGNIPVGTTKITSCCFGGTHLEKLFVSTQGGDRSLATPKKEGGIFMHDMALEPPEFLAGTPIYGKSEFLSL